ncbi:MULTISPECIES: Stk1 family PASTA domain-containing Ser/Thr kinase [unclassified Lactococcus]|uniref:Stk1 family PASTA domain-containing Ser/Thr kinase n=1 Tax=unclassified Lactococcus TaxID=2643510 RepID=UPI0011CA81BC|nr:MULTISPECIES: Stk1 family PASTA domain-containing Ser/Thr kinase [unclassified Lactococcus]MQW23762.1 Stk1 family PASTA domain-containing Ser/Thr kinase [Lactococcus sp. dk101]TXK37443.1 Stk1 family PASTA domain-containing Ser/Thr kinase [Lactococcus sp. dk310]TXK48786.1 Stk1 family PASTA domain-containing Ser/Thr kinase [Lactococcus sp. dk322]
MIQIGKIFADRYKIITEIGRGGMANVYKGEDTFLDHRPVAIKVLRSNFENDNIAIARFQREAFAMAELSHPNIVGISDVGEYENQQYIVMEFIDGMTLKQYINGRAPLSNEEAISITMEILSAMEMAHGHGIIHRDLKPQNVMISNSGLVKVTDFGIAKALSETSLTQTNTMFGSVHYLSPEQARGANATVQSDIYAIGIILFELLTGQIPFDGDSAVAIALKHFQENIPSIINLNHDVPQALENVVIRATAKDMNDRYADVTEMMEDLATSTSPERRGEEKLVFKKDNSATKMMPSNLINPYDTKPLIDSKADKMPERHSEQTDDAKAEAAEKTPENNKPKKKSRKGLIALIIVLIAVIAGVAFAWTSMTPKNTTVPDVAGLTYDEAKTEIQAANLKVGKQIKQQSTDVESGKVMKTDPASGTEVRENSSVNIYVSKGNSNVISMDNYVGQDIDSALNDLLVKYNITSDMVTKNYVANDSYKAGTIFKQTPAKGESFDTSGNDKIVFEISKGAEATIPSYRGQNAVSYQSALQNLGFTNVTLNPIATPGSTSGWVAGLNVEVGKSYTLDTQIVIDVTQAVESSSSSSSSSSSTSESSSSSSSPSSSSSTTESSSSPTTSSSSETTTTQSSN